MRVDDLTCALKKLKKRMAKSFFRCKMYRKRDGNEGPAIHLEATLRLPLAAAALAIVLCTSGAYAGSVTLYLTGTFADGAALGGTITVDQTAGAVTALNVTIGAPDAGSFTVSQGYSTGGVYYNVGMGTTGGIYPSLSLALATTTLVGYNGGAICSTHATCGGVVAGLFKASGSPAVALTVGNASPTPPGQTVSVPALSPRALCGLMLLLAVSVALLHRRAKQPRTL